MNPANLYKSVFLEILAITTILMDRRFYTVLSFFAFHGLASFLISQVILALMPVNYKKKRAQNLLFLTIFNTGTLLFGYLASFYLVTVLLRRQKKTPRYGVDSLNLNELFIFPSIRRQLGEGSAALALGKHEIPKALKLKILFSFADENTANSVKLIKNFLSDEDSEIRLYSFQALNRIKNDINLKISEALNSVEDGAESSVQAGNYKRLAFYYSYMFNMEISDDDLRFFFTEKTLYYISKASETLKEDAELLFLETGIRAHEKNYPAAIRLAEKAISCGMDTYIVYPLLCEIYYSVKDYKKVREIILKDYSLKLDLAMAPVVQLWEAGLVSQKS